MHSPVLLTLLSVAGISLLSLLSIVFFLWDDKRLGKVLLYVVSFSTGALLGDVFIHILPDLAEDQEFFGQAMLLVLLGILFSFVIEKVIHWRHCHVIGEGHEHCHPVGMLSLIGDGIHNFIDGMIIAAAYLTSPSVGFATTLAVIFHEIPQEIGDGAILMHSGFTRKKTLIFNMLSALTAILGAVLVLGLSTSIAATSQYLMPFAAGNLLYIAGSDLIPELHKHTHVKQGVLQSIGMILGMGSMYVILFFE